MPENPCRNILCQIYRVRYDDNDPVLSWHPCLFCLHFQGFDLYKEGAGDGDNTPPFKIKPLRRTPKEGDIEKREVRQVGKKKGKGKKVTGKKPKGTKK
jgi:hypothetical protein